MGQPVSLTELPRKLNWATGLLQFFRHIHDLRNLLGLSQTRGVDHYRIGRPNALGSVHVVAKHDLASLLSNLIVRRNAIQSLEEPSARTLSRLGYEKDL
jgi:hypothetical protein